MGTHEHSHVLVLKKEEDKRRKLESVIHNAFKRLQFDKQKRFFKHFKKKTVAFSGLTQVELKFDESNDSSFVVVTFFIDKRHSKICVPSERRANFLTVLIGYQVDIQTLLSLLETEFARTIKGDSRESAFIIAATGIEKSGVKIVSIAKTSAIDNSGKGIDVHIDAIIDTKLYSGIPLQLKSFKKDQKKHIQKFPTVPSLLYCPDLYTQKMFTKHVVEIVRAKALHNVSLHLFPSKHKN